MTLKAPIPQSFVPSLAAYLPGKSKIEGGAVARIIKLSSNENPRGASPLAQEAYARAATALHRYPQDGALALREALCAHHGFDDPTRIICGAGSDDVIRMVCAAYGGVGREVIYSRTGFAMYPIYAQQSGARAIAADETDLRADVDALLACVTPRTAIVFLANPNNPTGNYITRDEITRLRNALPEEVMLVLDGAYSEYMADVSDYTDGREWCELSNTLIMRTFSKAYGISSLRVGWGYGPKPIIDMLYKVRSPFNITQPSMNAAIAALADDAFLQAHISENNQQRAWLASEIAALNGIQVLPCFANFLLLRFGNNDAAAANQALLQQGIIVREVANYGLPDCLRISIGTPEENEALLSTLKAWHAHG
jgi:histidinol-phosphate aminotransferase